MPAYMNWRVEFASRAHAEKAMREAIAAGLPGDLFTIHDTPPVILAGLVKAGEIRTLRQWNDEAKTGEALCVGANGRVIDNFAPAAHVESVLPITWYRYPEAP